VNTIFEYFNIKLAYNRGKETGIAGLVGIAVAIACVALWDYIRPVLEFLGVINLLDKLGLIYHGEPGMTWYRLFWGFLSMYAIGVIIFLALLVVVVLFSAFIQTKFSNWLQYIFVLTFFGVFLFLPLLIITVPFAIVLGIIEAISFIKNPSKYKNEWKEKKRLKNKDIELQLTSEVGISEQAKLNPLYDSNLEINRKLLADAKGETFVPTPKENPNYKEDNEITFEEAFRRLNRLPIHGDYRFIIGVTYDRKFYMLLPKPLNLEYPRRDVFCAQEMNVQRKGKLIKKDEKLSNTMGYELTIRKSTHLYYFENIDYYKIEHYYDIGDAPVFVQEFKNLHINEPYRLYVEDIQLEYFTKKSNLIEKLMDTQQKENHETNLYNLNSLLVGNDETVSLIRYANTRK